MGGMGPVGVAAFALQSPSPSHAKTGFTSVPNSPNKRQVIPPRAQEQPLKEPANGAVSRAENDRELQRPVAANRGRRPGAAPDAAPLSAPAPRAAADTEDAEVQSVLDAARPSSQTPAPQGVFQAQHRPSGPPPQRRGSPPRGIASSPSVRTAARSPKAKSPLQVLRGGAGWEVQHNECGIGRPPL